MNYEEIIDGLQIESVIKLMESLGVDRYEEKENCIIFPTICHNVDIEDASMKLYFYKDTKLFVCYTECGNMSIFKLLKHYYESRQIEYSWYEDIYQAVINCSINKGNQSISQYKSIRDKYKKRQSKNLVKYDENVLQIFQKYYPIEWLEDGITTAAMDKFNILYSNSQNKIIIPHYDIEGNLIGIRGRALDKWEIENVGKYLPIKIEQTWYKHPLSMNLYGLNKNKENIKKYGYVFLFESELRSYLFFH